MSFTAVYIRVSTTSQNEAGQKMEIEKWLSGNSVDRRKVKWFIDKSSGDNLNRSEFQRLEKDVFQGLINTVVVWKLDRLSRSLKDGITTLCDFCDKGIRVVSVTQQIDFSGAIGKMIASVLFAVAALEQETRRERQSAGIEAAKSRGVYTGRPKGATKSGVDPSRAGELREQGLTQSEISQAMGVSVSSVRRYLKAG